MTRSFCFGQMTTSSTLKKTAYYGQTTNWTPDLIVHRGLEWLIHKGPDLDYIGMQMFQTEKFTALCLETYIKETLDILGQMNSSTTADTPICKPIDGDSKKLDAAGVRLYMVAIGPFG